MASNNNNESIRQLATRRPFEFLSLAPKTSDSYPRVQKAKEPRVDADEAAKRRTSSLGSDGAKSPTALRFLKLGPVHWGEHQGEHNSDWHEIAVVE